MEQAVQWPDEGVTGVFQKEVFMEKLDVRSEALQSVPSQGFVTVDLLKASYRSDSFPQDWTKEQRERALLRYFKWLQLKLRNPKARLAPTRDIDHFWHLHMLSPVAYYKDCMRLFGRLLDHDGGFGKGAGELPILQKVFKRTAQMWEEEYGEA